MKPLPPVIRHSFARDGHEISLRSCECRLVKLPFVRARGVRSVLSASALPWAAK